MLNRRGLIKSSGALAAAFSPLQAFADTVALPSGNGERPVAK